MYPDSLKNLIESFKYLPSVGEKTAERYAFSVLDMDEDQIELFVDSLKNIKNRIHPCKNCNVLTEDEICSICSDDFRNKNVLCIVEDVKSVFLFEKIGMFKGLYHVLKGLISPLDGVNPEDIGIDKLLDRIQNEKFEEIIFAFKPSIEGETTALYIKKILDGLNLKITKIANGVPIGADMEYVDSLTLERALSDRKEV
ncbi:MAG: recombination protein RecR [Bacilli bacterium]|nr:recombination protein RecR [Bacilli bacterium]